MRSRSSSAAPVRSSIRRSCRSSLRAWSEPSSRPSSKPRQLPLPAAAAERREQKRDADDEGAGPETTERHVDSFRLAQCRQLGSARRGRALTPKRGAGWSYSERLTESARCLSALGGVQARTQGVLALISSTGAARRLSCVPPSSPVI